MASVSYKLLVLLGSLGFAILQQFWQGNPDSVATPDSTPLESTFPIIRYAKEKLGVVIEGITQDQKADCDEGKLREATKALQDAGEWFKNHQKIARLYDNRIENMEKRMQGLTHLINNFSEGLELTWKQLDNINKLYSDDVTKKLEIVMSSVELFHKQIESIESRYQLTSIENTQDSNHEALPISERLSEIEKKLEMDRNLPFDSVFNLDNHLGHIKSLVADEIISRHKFPEDLSSHVAAVDEATVATMNRVGSLETKLLESEKLQAELLTLSDSLIKRDNEINNLTAIMLELVKSVQISRKHLRSSTERRCDMPYMRIAEDCVALTKVPSSWKDNLKICRTFGGHLSVPSNLTVLARYLQNNNVTEEIWIGGSEVLWGLEVSPSTKAAITQKRTTQDRKNCQFSQTSSVTDQNTPETIESKTEKDGSEFVVRNDEEQNHKEKLRQMEDAQTSSSSSSCHQSDEEENLFRISDCIAIVLQRTKIVSVIRSCNAKKIALCQEGN